MIVELKNLGTVNKNFVEIKKKNGDRISIWFSYSTAVGVSSKHGFFVRENDWSTTTGKLLNELEPDKSKRISGEKFERELEKALK